MPDLTAWFFTLFLLALMPTGSGLLVVSNTLGRGLSHGVVTALGIAAGDICFILIAVSGLAVAAGVMADYLPYLKYVGGVWLLWLGILLWRSRPHAITSEPARTGSHFTGFMAGLLITLADQKAVLFYLGLFPAFFDMRNITATDVVAIVVLAGFAVGIPKVIYALAAHRARMYFNKPGLLTIINRLTGSVLILLAGVLFVSRP
ncbi:MAG: LysE family translocator [Gammaproteobacteria bacterium]|nr:LysE family translocator [Gammaproteobacteria bacterium]MDH5650614.1 LysE family translocator [Gammaproteobacteria bacterium]